MPLIDEALDLAQLGSPANPASGRNKLFIKSDGKLYIRDSAGAETVLLAVSAPLTVHVGYRSTAANQSVASGTLTTMNLGGTADHDVGSGFSKSSDVVTITNAGVYKLHAFLHWSAGTAGRRKIILETWTGSDPGVGLATSISAAEASGDGTVNTALNCGTQRTFAAGAKVRVVLFQTGASLATLGGSGYLHQLNIARLS